ncbi:MAG: ATP-dependent helicase [Candidatus Omnitrophota bacterium]|jgi:DNA helicase-2/ATP-dependent DNA helicase PcrA
MKSYKLEPFYSGVTIDYEENLNYQQLKVVKEGDGAALVLAGAGSGKTRVLIYRLAYLLQKGVSPENILLVTFTNKAAKEMINRAETVLKSTLKGLWAGTFHHVGNMLLRKEASAIGYSPSFTIIDKEDSKDLLEDCIEELGYTKHGKLFPKKDIISNIYSISVNSLKSIDNVIKDSYPHTEEYLLPIKSVLRRYEEKKKQSNTMDFNDLLKYWLKILEVEEICKKYSENFKYILVDEYQDTNRIQFEILKRLSSYNKNILVVGDDAQSIYSFRGADINNLLNFPKTFEGACVYKLEINYRSSPQILQLANNIIKHNINQFPKTLKSVKPDAEKPMSVQAKDVYLQAKFVAQRTLEMINEGIPLKEIAVLFRSHFQALELEIELMKRNIPYIVRGGVRFFEQAHIKDVLAYLKIINNPSDELSFKRAVSLYKGIGRSYAAKIWKMFIEGKKEPGDVTNGLPKKQQDGFREFSSKLQNLKVIDKPQAAIQEVLAFYKDYCCLVFDNPDDRILDLEELAKMAADYPTIKKFLLELGSFDEFKGETVLSAQDRKEFLTLSTIHQAKGLEWETVFIIGFSDYEFPHPKALAHESALEEERRLFYVAATRAKSLLYITYPETKFTFKNGLVIARPSMFLTEISNSNYEGMYLEDSL